MSSEIAGDVLALAAHRVGGFELVDDRVDPGHGGDPEPGTTRDHLEQQGVEAAAGLVLEAAEVAMSLRQQLQHPGMIIGAHRGQVVGAECCDRDRAGVVGVVLLRLPRAQHAHSRRPNWGHIDHVLARRDELLGEEIAQSMGRLDRPRPLLEPVRPLAQTHGLGRTRSDTDLVEDMFVAIDSDSGVGALVRVDPDGDGHELDAFLGDGNRGGHS